MRGAFITGTDTGVGKTYFTALWTRSLRKAGIRAIALKPISSGDRADARTLSDSMENELSMDEINPIHFVPPLSPWAACRLTGQIFPREKLKQHLAQLEARLAGPFLVEGVGGWRVPLDKSFHVREWAVELKWPVVIVARAGLGTLNHVLLTVDSVRQTQLPILGIVVNYHQAPDDEATRTNPQLIEELTGLPTFPLSFGVTALEVLPAWLRFLD